MIEIHPEFTQRVKRSESKGFRRVMDRVMRSAEGKPRSLCSEEGPR
jgi:hypothetical protein